ncbi:GntR family transcriptional regulator [Roseovarius tibetensis]|uniref:GntR family transcriptional regulator n=1 Tax=Roseovarius tibetensis TaxID=2685897 RepID=UPI003D7F69E5
MTNLTEEHPRNGTPTPRGMLREKAYQTLKQGILHGQLRRGERLSEARLMREFDIGRTPLREALNRLEREGLAVSQPNSGYSVANLDVDAVCDLLVVREGLDALAAEIAVETANEDDMRRLAAVMEEIEALDLVHERTPDVYARELELGLKVHEVILNMTRNEALQEITQRVYDQLRLALWVEVRWIEQWKLAVEEHRAIVAAVTARDARAAVVAARACPFIPREHADHPADQPSPA